MTDTKWSAVALAAALAAAPLPALAKMAHPPGTQELFADHQRCDALTQQFNRVATSRTVDAAAQKQASQGAALCRAGRYGEGADTLDKAMRMLGETPAR